MASTMRGDRLSNATTYLTQTTDVIEAGGRDFDSVLLH